MISVPNTLNTWIMSGSTFLYSMSTWITSRPASESNIIQANLSIAWVHIHKETSNVPTGLQHVLSSNTQKLLNFKISTGLNIQTWMFLRDQMCSAASSPPLTKREWSFPFQDNTFTSDVCASATVHTLESWNELTQLNPPSVSFRFPVFTQTIFFLKKIFFNAMNRGTDLAREVAHFLWNFEPMKIRASSP